MKSRLWIPACTGIVLLGFTALASNAYASILHAGECQTDWGQVLGANVGASPIPVTLGDAPALPGLFTWDKRFAIPAAPIDCGGGGVYLHSEIDEIRIGVAWETTVGKSLTGTVYDLLKNLGNEFGEIILAPRALIDGGFVNFGIADFAGAPLIFTGNSIDLQGVISMIGGGVGTIEVTGLNVLISGTHHYVPIPAAVWLFGSGLLGLIGIARRKKTA